MSDDCRPSVHAEVRMIWSGYCDSSPPGDALQVLSSLPAHTEHWVESWEVFFADGRQRSETKISVHYVCRGQAVSLGLSRGDVPYLELPQHPFQNRQRYAGSFRADNVAF